jgi:hypothetical protein
MWEPRHLTTLWAFMACYRVSFTFLWLLKHTSNELTNILSNVGFEVFRTVVMKSSIFWDITLCTLLKINQHFRGTCQFHFKVQGGTAFHLLSRWFLAWLIFLTLTTEATCSFKTSVDFQQTTWRYIPEDRTLHSKECTWMWRELRMFCKFVIIVWKFFSVL